MSDLPYFRRLARYNSWANRRIFGAVGQLDTAAWEAPRSGFFGSLQKTLNHILVADRIWLARFEGRDHGMRSLDQILHPDFAGLERARKTEDARIENPGIEVGVTRVVAQNRLDAIHRCIERGHELVLVVPARVPGFGTLDVQRLGRRVHGSQQADNRNDQPVRVGEAPVGKSIRHDTPRLDWCAAFYSAAESVREPSPLPTLND